MRDRAADEWVLPSDESSLAADDARLIGLPPSVVRVRIEGLRGVELAALVERVVALCEADLVAGAMVTVDEHSVRVKGSPLVR